LRASQFPTREVPQSGAVAALVEGDLPGDATPLDLSWHRLNDREDFSRAADPGSLAPVFMRLPTGPWLRSQRWANRRSNARAL